MHRTPLGIYQSLLTRGRIQPDPAQELAAAALDDLWHQLVAGRRSRFLRRIRGDRRPDIRGVYLWGGVGRGKTWLMDLFFEALPLPGKQRIHFHRFMARVHAALKERETARDPLDGIAEDSAQRCRLLCFDEFHVGDIADAMLLGGLLDALLGRGVVLVATSNLHPDDLYRDGLQRARFLPAIELLKKHTHVLEIEGQTDFRLRILERTEIYHHPLDDEADRVLAQGFQRFCRGVVLAPILEINGREFTARERGDGVIWFDFDELCRKPRSTLDYIEIARAFNTVLLSGVPQLDDTATDATRRFINLVDEFYDRNVKLLVSAATAAEDLYRGQRLAFEFERTVSRLTEMQSHDYLARPHLP